MTRVEQTERNRSRVLTAARRVFVARGYHASTLEQIADEAGFSKGVVYSQFDSKADLFLALLDARIALRARENAELVDGLAGAPGVAAFVDHAVREVHGDPSWTLLLLEFRVHAARDPELSARYAAAHARAVSGVAFVFDALYERAGQPPPFPPRELAELVYAIGGGAVLEQAADPDALQGPLLAELLTRLMTPAPTSSEHTAQPRETP
jgi:AcrR family transcriptional regulator